MAVPVAAGPAVAVPAVAGVAVPRSVWALVAVKRVALGKRRLAAVLAPAIRRRLVLAMLRDVLDAVSALVGADGLAGILVVTSDPAASAIARGYGGARVIADPPAAASNGEGTDADGGYTLAVAAGLRGLAASGVAAALVLPADVPLVTPDELRQVLASGRGDRVFGIVPARDGQGSNAVLVAPPDALPLRFDGRSFEPHCRAAAAAGLVPVVMRFEGLGLDIDDPVDLEALAAHARAPATRAGRMAGARARARARSQPGSPSPAIQSRRSAAGGGGISGPGAGAGPGPGSGSG
jgi:2-phospho-L-lactate guanylyltransferase